MMLLLLALLLGTQAIDNASWELEANVDRSEWSGPNLVKLDLRTGNFTIVAQPPFQSPTHTAVAGTLKPEDLQRFRSATKRLATDGPRIVECILHPSAFPLMISNGGPYRLDVKQDGKSISAPDTQTCWTQAAKDLQTMLEARFSRGSQ